MGEKCREWLETELEFVYQKILSNLSTFIELVPAAVSENYWYPAVPNEDWTDGFWVGMLQLAQLYRPNKKISKVIDHQLREFQYRLDEEIVLNHHDIGFLYSLSAVADYRLHHRETSKQMALQAANILMRRYQEKAQILQAWGDLDQPEEQGRMIIDCNMNLPLLFFASDQTGDDRYRQAAANHLALAQKYLVRPDDSTFHTYYMDIKTGEPRFGKTAQGYSDSSCWSRGQAWGIYGFSLNFRHLGEIELLETAGRLADYFLARLPKDQVCYWDLVFVDGEEPRDTSAAAIAACGLIELSDHLPLSDGKKRFYLEKAYAIIQSLANSYTTKGLHSNGLLMQGVYSKPTNLGVNECTLWGDYFYLEALFRMYQSWNTFW